MRGIPLPFGLPGPLPRTSFKEFPVDKCLLFASLKPLRTRETVAGGTKRVSNSTVLALVNGNLPVFEVER
jgi:hypothetical protein